MKNYLKESGTIHIGYIFIFTNIFLMISSYWFSYNNFYLGVILLTVALALALFLKKSLLKYLIILNIAFYLFLLFFNYNYFFIFAIMLILGVIALRLIRDDFKVPSYVYSLIPLFILLHVVWFNLLPLGFNDDFTLDVGSAADLLENSQLYIQDPLNVLSPAQSYGDSTWREMERDGTFYIDFNTPMNLTGKRVEVSMEYDATGQIYINDELFYDPAWGSAVKHASFKEEYVYGSDMFNLSLLYEDVSLNEFLNITNNDSLSEYILYKYKTNLEPHNSSYLGTRDIWKEREKLKQESNLSLIMASDFFRPEDPLENISSREELLEKTNKSNIGELLRTPLETFLYQKNLTLQQFLDSELNSGPYPRKRPIEDKSLSIEEYVRKNFPDGVLLEDYTGHYKELESDMNSLYISKMNSVDNYPNWSPEPKMIKTSLRGPSSIYSLFSKTISLSLKKQDLNLYPGSDAVGVEIRDFNKDLVANWTIEDTDNIHNRTAQESSWEEYSFSTPINQSGIYYIEFSHKFPSEDPDFLISNITLNSNEAMYEGDMMIWGPMTVYNNGYENSVLVRYWWDGYDQFITFGDNTRFDLSKELMNSWVTLNISDNSSLSFSKGKLIVDSALDLAAFEDSYINTDMSNRIIITKSADLRKENTDFTNIDGLNITATKGTKIYELDVSVK